MNKKNKGILIDKAVQNGVKRTAMLSMVLLAGTYTVTYEAINPNQDNKKLGDWKFEDVQVKQGKDKDSATTILSSVNAKN